MTTDEIREKYLNYFKSSPRNHKEITPSPLVLEGDPTTLFTSAGMQPLIPYLKGKLHPQGKRLVDSQPSLRMQDIDEIGDKRHTLFFEMLGNWSLGDYFKKEQIPWIWEFFTRELNLKKENLWVSVFEGGEGVPKDDESFDIWRKLGVAENKIFTYTSRNNWWSRSGEPSNMPAGEIGGPDSEIFYDLGKDRKIHENSSFKNRKCHPNCNCGRFIEIGNSVFIQYIKNEDGTLKELPQKNVDFGGGLERIAMAVNNNFDMFAIDIFTPVIKALETETLLKYSKDEEKDKSFRICADHIRASVMLIAEGVTPSNKLQGYVLRRLLRRALFHIHLMGSGISGGALVHAAESFKQSYKIVKKNWSTINETIGEEGAKFEHTLNRGMRKLANNVKEGSKIDGKFAFDLYQTDGFPLELTLEVLNQNGVKIADSEKEVFKREFEKHQDLSRASSAKMFKGGLADTSEQVIRLHTATHLLHQALRMTLGQHVSQKGSNITSERLRFDFSHPSKLKGEELAKIEEIVNEQIDKNLPVSFKEMMLSDARKEGALAFFGEKYGEKVKVYTIGLQDGGWFSKEVCGGPHVSSTSEIGHVKIIKQEKVGTNIVRIYAVLG